MTGNFHAWRPVQVAGPGLAVAVLAFALFAPTIRHGFVAIDDPTYVEANPMVRRGVSAEALRWAWTTDHVGYWAPVLWMSYQADAEILGPEPWGFHATNVLLHALNAGLFCWLLRRWTKSAGLAFALALLWAVHPLRVESVAWIAGRKDVLSGLFFLLCLLFYTGGGEARGWKYAAGAACLTLGMWTKPGTLITTPFVLLLLDVWPLRRYDWTWPQAVSRIREKWAYWLSALGFGFVAWQVTRSVQYVREDMPPWGERLLLIPGNYLAYLRQAVWPADLSVLYPTPEFRAGLFAVAAAGLAAGIRLAWINRRRCPAWFAGLFWALGMLAPSIGLVWTGTSEGLGDRFTYLPAMGVCAIGAGAWAWRAGRGWRGALAGAAVCAGVAWMWASHRQLACWRDSDALLARAVDAAPRNVVARIGHGDRLAARRQWAEALREYEWVASTRHQMRWQAVVRAARCQLHLGQPELALRILEDMDVADPNIRLLRQLHLGQALMDAGRAAEALPQLQAVLQRHPEVAELWPDYLQACFDAGKEQEGLKWAMARARFDVRAIRRMEDLLPFYMDKWNRGEKHRALVFFRKIIARNGSDPLAMNNFAWLLAVDPGRTAEPRLALDCAERAMALGGDASPGVLDTLAVARANAGDFPGALRAAEQALALAEAAGDPGLAAAISRRLEGFRRGQAWRDGPD